MNDAILQYVLAWIVGLAGISVCFFGHGVLRRDEQQPNDAIKQQQPDMFNQNGLEISASILAAAYVSLKVSYLLGKVSSTSAAAAPAPAAQKRLTASRSNLQKRRRRQRLQ